MRHHIIHYSDQTRADLVTPEQIRRKSSKAAIVDSSNEEGKGSTEQFVYNISGDLCRRNYRDCVGWWRVSIIRTSPATDGDVGLGRTMSLCYGSELESLLGQCDCCHGGKEIWRMEW